jgi:hypothetical protein
MFTARYALNLYIKQIRYVFKGLINSTEEGFSCKANNRCLSINSLPLIEIEMLTVKFYISLLLVPI